MDQGVALIIVLEQLMKFLFRQGAQFLDLYTLGLQEASSRWRCG